MDVTVLAPSIISLYFVKHKLEMKEADIMMHLSFIRVHIQHKIQTQMGAIAHVDRRLIRGLHMILLMSTGVIYAEVYLFPCMYCLDSPTQP
jgi:hypothetical protein